MTISEGLFAKLFASEIVPAVRRLYKTYLCASPWPLAGCIYGPSYFPQCGELVKYLKSSL